LALYNAKATAKQIIIALQVLFIKKGLLLSKIFQDMTTVRVASGTNVPLSDVLMGIAHLETPELERFQQDVSRLLAQRRAPHLNEQETILLQKINDRVVPSLWKRYESLHKKLQAETISPEEHSELSTVIGQIEAINVEWLKNVAELARLQGVSLQELMRKLKLSSPYASKENS
jgi:hypothetical protein